VKFFSPLFPIFGQKFSNKKKISRQFSESQKFAVACQHNDRVLNLQSRGCGFDSRLGRYQVVITWLGGCQWTGKLSHHITNTKVYFVPLG